MGLDLGLVVIICALLVLIKLWNNGTVHKEVTININIGIIETYYGHNAEVLDIDYINQNDFISSGNDHQNIIWKT